MDQPPNTPRKTLKKLSLFYKNIHSDNCTTPHQALEFASSTNPIKESSTTQLKESFDRPLTRLNPSFSNNEEEDDEMTVDPDELTCLKRTDKSCSSTPLNNHNSPSNFQKLIAEYRDFIRPGTDCIIDETALDESDALYATLLDYTFLLKKKMDELGEKERLLELKRAEFMEQVTRAQIEHRKEVNEVKELERRLESQIETEKILYQRKEELDRKSSLLDHELALATLDIKEKLNLYTNRWYQYAAAGMFLSFLLQIYYMKWAGF